MFSTFSFLTSFVSPPALDVSLYLSVNRLLVKLCTELTVGLGQYKAEVSLRFIFGIDLHQ